MKKILIIIALFTIIYVFINNNDYYVIPKEAIRFRIVANSNSFHDQYIKHRVKETLEKDFYNTLNSSKTIDESRINIVKNLNNYENAVESVLKEENYNKDFSIKYGLNYFPEKEYQGVLYEEGEYESLLVTLGEGKGDNWWCVLFPPICTLEVEEQQEVEYKFFIKDFINKYLTNK